MNDTVIEMSAARRGFLAGCARLGLSGTLLPGVLWAQLAAAGTQTATVPMIKDAARLAGAPRLHWRAAKPPATQTTTTRTAPVFRRIDSIYALSQPESPHPARHSDLFASERGHLAPERYRRYASGPWDQGTSAGRVPGAARGSERSRFESASRGSAHRGSCKTRSRTCPELCPRFTSDDNADLPDSPQHRRRGHLRGHSARVHAPSRTFASSVPASARPPPLGRSVLATSASRLASAA